MSQVELSPIDNTPSYRRVAQVLEQAILRGELSPGDLLPTEHQLAEQLGVHRSTVREGIRVLENAGLIRRAGGKRLIVSLPNKNEVAWTMTRALGLHKVSFLELWETQYQLEPFAAGLAAQRSTGDLRKELRDNLEAMEASLDDDHAIIELDVAFHRLVAEATLNRVLVLAGKPISMLLFPATRMLYERVPQARQRLMRAHREIAEAIFAGDHERARLWMERHIRDFRVGYQLAGLDAQAPIDFDPKVIPR